MLGTSRPRRGPTHKQQRIFATQMLRLAEREFAADPSVANAERLNKARDIYNVRHSWCQADDLKK